MTQLNGVDAKELVHASLHMWDESKGTLMTTPPVASNTIARAPVTRAFRSETQIANLAVVSMNAVVAQVQSGVY